MEARKFKLVSDYTPTGDQPEAINDLVDGLNADKRHQILLGVTGSGKTFTIANVIEKVQRPTLVVVHNKTLAAQLCSEFKEFFPDNAVEYFISYFDYYQPEAYIAATDTYIEKDSSRNDEIDKMRHAATSALFDRRDVIVVASVSCIYGLGDPDEYNKMVLSIRQGARHDRDEIIRRLVEIQYNRNDMDMARGTFRVRGDTLDIFPSSSADRVIRVEFFGDEIEKITEVNAISGELISTMKYAAIFPATHYVASSERMQAALKTIEEELEARLAVLKSQGKIIEAYRLEQRTRYDLEMMAEIGFCQGIENYSRHLSGREPGSPPYTLIDYFPEDFLMVIDESHVTVPQIGGMYAGDRSRKESLVEFGFRLESAFDNRPLRFNEFEERVNQVIYVSATPGPYERGKAGKPVEQIIRPTGLIDPEVSVRPVEGQIDDLIHEIRETVAKDQRVLVTTLTKRMAESLTTYLQEMELKVKYLHSEVQTLERTVILRDLRIGEFDVLVGINLLREGLDLPEVSLVAILDADKEGFLRSETSLIQTIGRAARNVDGRVIMYADTVTDSMKRAIDETNRRRGIQKAYNDEHGITPTTIQKGIRDLIEISVKAAEDPEKFSVLYNKDLQAGTPKADLLKKLEAEMFKAAKNLDFEKAAIYRDRIAQIKKEFE